MTSTDKLLVSPCNTMKSESKVAEQVSVQYNDSTSVEDNTGLEKRFSLWSVSSLQYSLICSSLAIGSFLSTVIGIGGSPFLIYGFILATTLDLVICYSLAEIASAYPHSSAQVHWTYCLAPPNYKRFMSFFVGVLSCAGWIFAIFTTSYTGSMFIVALAQVYHSDYVPELWHYYVIYIAIVALAYIVNLFFVSALPYITYALVGIINAGTIFIIVALLARTSNKQSAEFVFVDIVNESGWDSKGVVFFLSLLPSIAAVTLFDGASHMTDEVPQPERNIPLVMVIANTLSAVAAFGSMIVYMFCIANVANMSAPVGGQPFIQLMNDAFRSKALTTVGSLVLISVFLGSNIGYVCSTSRLFWSFSNSNALPFGVSFFGHVNTKLQVPANAIHLIVFISLVLGTMILGSSSALSAILGSSMVAINLSYLFPIACLLVKSKFSMSPHARYTNDSSEPIALQQSTSLPYFNLGKFGMLANVVSVIWVCFIMVWLNFPTTYPVSGVTMNYACVVLGVTFIIGLALWLAYARKHYNHDRDLKHQF